MSRPMLSLPEGKHAISVYKYWYEVSSNTLSLDEIVSAINQAGYTVIGHYINRFGCWIVKFR